MYDLDQLKQLNDIIEVAEALGLNPKRSGAAGQGWRSRWVG